MNKRKLMKQIKLGNTRIPKVSLTIESQVNRYIHTNYNPLVITPVKWCKQPKKPKSDKEKWRYV